MTDSVVALVPGETDEALAARLKADLMVHLTKVIALMEEAKRAGLNLQFNMGMDPVGRTVVQHVSVVKFL